MKRVFTGMLVALGSVVALAAACRGNSNDDNRQLEPRPEYFSPAPGVAPGQQPGLGDEPRSTEEPGSMDEADETERMGGGGGFGGAQSWPGE